MKTRGAHRPSLGVLLQDDNHEGERALPSQEYIATRTQEYRASVLTPCFYYKLKSRRRGALPLLSFVVYKEIVFLFIIDYSSLRDFGLLVI